MMPASASRRSDVRGTEGGDGLRVEAGEGPAVALALAEDGEPAQPGLSALEHQELEEQPVVVHRHAPLLVVVGVEEGLVAHPGAAHGRCQEAREDSLWMAAAVPNAWKLRCQDQSVEPYSLAPRK